MQPDRLTPAGEIKKKKKKAGVSNADKQFKRFNMLPLRNGNNRLPVGPCAEWRPTYHDGCENRFEQMQADADLSNMA